MSSRKHGKQILQGDFAMDVGRGWIVEKTNIVHMRNIAEDRTLFLL
jgi:hypothetical protein